MSHAKVSRQPAGRKAIAAPLLYATLTVVAIAVSISAAMVFGSADITWNATMSVIGHHLFGTELPSEVAKSSDTIIWQLRAPRGVLAAIVGAGLAVSGVAMQTLVRNPLADPYLLGISAGAGVGATAVILFGVFSDAPIGALTFGALLGAVAATIAVGAIARAGGGLTPLRLVLSGVVLSAAFSALSSFMVFAGPDPRAAQSVMFWMLGSVAGATWSKTAIPLAVLLMTLAFFLLKARHLDALATGDSTAAAVGINVSALRSQVFVAQAVLVGTLVAVSGGIGFVGLVIPHLTRMLIGAAHRVVLPLAALFGGLFLVWVDIVARVIGGSQEMPLGVVTGLIGAPLFLYLMTRGNYTYGGSE
ncbi:sugar ABC transporter substrate-binding protein [Corynebacterium lactis RW2-5]|uniref:Sugar ABC transporter substrate-binding protein n=1 Tax=Corynebacterium lactis RW2-5 TaxID=1408189 RepID=A0A0K2GZA1_9CORY|nr:sugar ABC transporter substrate-binding protein [Corynebacterium lactis RW2-5]